MIFVDGVDIGDPEDVALRDRRMLSADGIFIVVATISEQDGRSVAEPGDHLPRRAVRRGAGRARGRDPRRGRGVAREVGGGAGARDLAAPVAPARRRGRVRLQAAEAPARWCCPWSSRSELAMGSRPHTGSRRRADNAQYRLTESTLSRRGGRERPPLLRSGQPPAGWRVTPHMGDEARACGLHAVRPQVRRAGRSSSRALPPLRRRPRAPRRGSTMPTSPGAITRAGRKLPTFTSFRSSSFSEIPMIRTPPALVSA